MQINQVNYKIVICSIKYKAYFRLVLLVSLILGSIDFFQYEKAHLTITKDDPVKTALIVVVHLSLCLFPDTGNNNPLNTKACKYH
jgi:hypothetical protein